MAFVFRVPGHPDAVVVDRDAVLLSMFALSPLEVKNVVRHVNPLSTVVLRVVKFFEDSARLVNELRTSRP